MLYSVQEASKILNISRVTIYKKIENVKELKQFVKVKNNTKYIDEHGFEILKQSVSNNNICKDALPNEQCVNNDCNDNAVNSSIVNQLTELQEIFKNQILSLQEQLKEKDRQIQALETVTQQTQVLFLNSQKQLESKENKEKLTFWQKLIQKK